jgi:hypothetical protein
MEDPAGTRRRHETAALLPRYLVALVVAGLAGLLGALAMAGLLRLADTGCAPGGGNCLDGTSFAVPAALGGTLAALVVLSAAAILIAYRADAETLDRVSRHTLWLAFAIAALPGLAWTLIWLSGGNARALYGVAAILLAAAPLLTARLNRALVPVVTGACFLVAVGAVLAWRPLFLLLPISTALAGLWAIALALSLRARALR